MRHQKAHNNIPRIKERLTMYVTMADSSKTTGLELCLGCQNKHPLEKCESIIEKEAFELEDQSIKESKTVI